MKLIENWRQAWRLWSVRVNALGAMLLGWVLLWPESILALWSLVTPEARDLLPRWLSVGAPLVLFLLALGARLVKQPDKPGEGGEKETKGGE